MPRPPECERCRELESALDAEIKHSKSQQQDIDILTKALADALARLTVEAVK